MAQKSMKGCALLLGFAISSVVTAQKPAERVFFQAARSGDLAAVRAQLDSGQDVNALDGTGSTALMLAVVGQHDDVSMLLLEKGANPNIADKKGQVPLMYAGNIFGLRRIGTLLVNTVDKRETPVILALIEHGADVNAVAGDGRTALFFAGKTGNIDGMKILIAKGAKVNAVDKDGMTLLMRKAAGLVEAGVSELCIAGADKSLKDMKGRTAQDIAQKYKGPNAEFRNAFLSALDKCR